MASTDLLGGGARPIGAADIFWLAEHRLQREGYECLPNFLMLALHLCT